MALFDIEALLKKFVLLVSHGISFLYSVRNRRAVSLPLASLVSHRKSLALKTPFDMGALLTKVRTAGISRNLTFPSSATGGGQVRFCRRQRSGQ